MKANPIALCVALALVACGSSAPGGTPADKLFEAVAPSSVAVVDIGSKSVDRKLGLGVPSPDWRHLYSVAGTTLVDTNPGDGAIQRSLSLGGAYALPATSAVGVPGGMSADGRWLVVEATAGGTTRLAVIATAPLTVAHRVTLEGDFTFDAINDLGTNLYLIQHLAGREYHVRLFDLNSNELTDNIVVDKSDGTQAMTGVRLSGVASPGHDWLFSMYVRERESPFIHALSLDGPFAFCLDLPGSGFAGDAIQSQWALAMSADGKQLFAVNPATGTIAVASTGEDGAPAVTRTAHFDAPGAGAAPMGSGGALLLGGTLVAAGSSGLTFIDTSSLKVTDRSVPGWDIAGVGLSSDGKTLYAVNEQGRVAVISAASHQVTAIFDPSAGTPMAVMRVSA